MRRGATRHLQTSCLAAVISTAGCSVATHSADSPALARRIAAAETRRLHDLDAAAIPMQPSGPPNGSVAVSSSYRPRPGSQIPVDEPIWFDGRAPLCLSDLGPQDVEVPSSAPGRPDR